MSTIVLSLDGLDEQIESACNDNADVIYWHHGAFAFTWLRKSDQVTFQGELQNLRHSVRKGDIVSVKAGESLQLKGKTFYPAELEFKGTECHAYMLIRRRGLFDDSINTPYLFVNESSRDKTVAYLKKALKK